MTKKFFLFPIFMVVFLILISFNTTPAYADMAPMNEHSVETCVVINNINNFPEIYLVGKVTKEVTGGEDEYRPIKQDECIKKYYKFNQFSLWHGKSGTTGSLQLITDKVSPNDEWVRMNDFLLRQTITYSLVKLDSDKYELVKIDKEVYPSIYLQYLLPLFFTILIELITILILIKILRVRDLRTGRALKTIVLVNAATFTPFWLLTSSAGMHIKELITVGEILIILVEGFAYYKMFNISKLKSLILSLIANGLSIASGIFMYILASWLFL